MSELTALTATQLVAGYETGAFTPLDVTHAALEQAVEAQERVNAFVRIDGETALRDAEAATERWRRGEPAGPVDGVPVTVKDILLQRGEPTFKGSWSVESDSPCDEDAPSVGRLRESGAVFLGKTTTPEFGWKGVTDSPRHGVTGNPYAPSRTAGGSSGGSAAAVAMGAGPLSLGTDGGGSVRIPASFCGIFALKPTYGRVPIYPASAFGTLAHVGPMTRDAEDAALLMDVITAPDTRDWSQLGPVTHSFRGALAAGAEGVRGLRIAYSPDFGGRVAVDPGVATAVRGAVALLAELGAHVEEADPGFEDPIEAFHTLWFSGAARVTQGLTPEMRERLDPGLREVCEDGAGRSALDYLAAVDVRMALGKLMGAFLSGSEGSNKHSLSGSGGGGEYGRGSYDLLVTPTMPITAFSAGVEVPEGSGLSRWTEWTPFSYPFNLTQQPAASVPCGVDRDGLPVGVQLVGARHADALVLSAAHALFEAGVASQVPSV